MIRKSLMATTNSTVMATYFGLKVEVLMKMEHCSLVRFREQELVVETNDLVFECAFSHAA